MLKEGLAFFWATRGIKDCLSPIVDDSDKIEAQQKIAYWYSLIDYQNFEEYETNSPGDLAKALTAKTGHHMLFPASYLSGTPHTKKLQKVMAYFAYLGYDTSAVKITLTPIQQKLLDLKKNFFVNAGPGTGKTSTAVRRCNAIINAGEKALVLAYQNSAKRTFKEAMLLFPKLYGNSSLSGIGETKNRFDITISTIDILALFILGQRGGTSDFEGVITRARDLLRYSPDRAMLKFYDGPDPIFHHIIVDESQIVSTSRYELIVELQKQLSTRTENRPNAWCSIIFIGDPKQATTSGCGEWFSAIISGENFPNLPVGPTKLLAFDVSFRYKNMRMMKFVNEISSQRPNLHVELRAHNPDPLDSEGPAIQCVPFGLMDEFVKYLGQRPTDTKSVLSLSLDKTNEDSKRVKSLINCFFANGLKFTVKGSGNFQGNGTVFTTWHSSIGSEADIVIIIGICGFPSRHPHLRKDVAESLLFVINTRAKKQIYYLMDNPSLPRGISENQVVCLDPSLQVTDFQMPDKFTCKIPTNWSYDMLFYDTTAADTFFAVNRILVKYSRFFSCNCTCDEYALSELIGLPKISFLNPGSTTPIKNFHSALIGGRVVRGGLIVDSSSFARPTDDMGITDSRDLYYWLQDKRSPAAPKENTAAEILNTLRLAMKTYMIENNMEDQELEIKNAVPCKDALSFWTTPRWITKHFMIFMGKADLAAYCQGSSFGKICIIIDLEGKIIKFFERPPPRVKYLLGCLREIHIHKMEMDTRRNLLGIGDGRSIPDTFFVDTEFCNNNTVIGLSTIEIGLISHDNPYVSICALVKCPDAILDFACDFLGIGRDDYLSQCIPLIDVISMVLRLSPNKQNFLYYNSKNDYVWMYKPQMTNTAPSAAEKKSRLAAKKEEKQRAQSEIDDGAVCPVTPINLMPSATEVAKTMGIFISDSHAISLEDLYSSLIMPLSLEYGIHHRALTDAIYLRSLCLLGKLPY